ncbi:MAG: PepSY-associated TM helix domain-containing protein [Oxalicibacterium faecigallinarum]|uniref:PepSY-associated TM helix domain-containing protein n=1 Tax=Oxalicibacterium faecigallinarum TaxID=573741 RepID=UPI0028091FF0|nr:PepSY-associated TM helix domain-containing protein [Oxalicibacterium faecigallinarum]MDQ7968850.1 PepSY-associated TM helix domain-containing protein [Oxalicibacterium faecigallinarum]
MKEGFRQSMAWLHTWSGLLVCWILLLVFTAGTSAYYRDEISLWMKPELHEAAAAKVSSAVAIENAIRTMEKEAGTASRWFISAPSDRNPAVSAGYSLPPAPGEKGRGKFVRQELDPATGAPMAEPRETRGGDFLYRLHFDLHYMPVLWARWLVGFCAMFMLAAIISGVITHKRIFKDFFTFRPKKGQRSWLDAHNAVAVLALPYHLMITYTGLITLMFMYMPAGVQVAYNGDQKTFQSEVFPGAENKTPAGVAAPLAPLGPMIAQAQKHWGGGEIDRITVNNPGDANATVNISRQQGQKLSSLRQAVQFDGVTGAMTSSTGDVPSGAAESRGVLMGLHLAGFADPLLRFLFFICGLAGCAMVATGALLWAVKKRQESAKVLAKGGKVGFGLRLVEGLNLGAIGGLPIAYASYFWANRLLPVGMEKRVEAEISWFFIPLAVVMVIGLVRATRGMWQVVLGVGGAMFMALPVLNVFTTQSHLGVTLLQGKGPWPVVGFDLFALVFGVALLYAVRHLQKKKTALKPVAKARPQPAQSVADGDELVTREAT